MARKYVVQPLPSMKQVKTGMTVDKLKFVTTRQHLRRRDESYFRLTPGQLYELFAEYELNSREDVQDFCDHRDPDSHGPRIVVHDSEAEPEYERPYLILDLRTPAEFEANHIMQARGFEAKLLNQDRMTSELYRYKNKEGGLIILYGEEERVACQAATTLIHRGFDNIFVLSGGLTGFARAFPAFVEGKIKLSPRGSQDRSSNRGDGDRHHEARTQGSVPGTKVHLREHIQSRPGDCLPGMTSSFNLPTHRSSNRSRTSPASSRGGDSSRYGATGDGHPYHGDMGSSGGGRVSQLAGERTSTSQSVTGSRSMRGRIVNVGDHVKERALVPSVASARWRIRGDGG
ncbi:unnamed protein product, partial [Choristocarpus tenellus]